MIEISKPIKSDSMTIEIKKALVEYTDGIKENITEIAKEIAHNSVEKLKETSPKKSGVYRRGWSVKENESSFVVYNRIAPQLTHLLEKGHAKKNGGRVNGIPHIAPVEEEAAKSFEKAIRGIVE